MNYADGMGQSAMIHVPVFINTGSGVGGCSSVDGLNDMLQGRRLLAGVTKRS
jgi:hypothetical protein